MSDAEKMLERVPFGQGSIRRSLITGLIFVFVFSLSVLPPLHTSAINRLGGVEIKDLIQSTQLLLVAIGFVFAVGAIIDAMADGFIIRGVSTVFNLLNCCFDGVPKSLRCYWIWVGFTICWSFIFWPAAIIVATVCSSAGLHRLYKLRLREKAGELLTEEAAQLYQNDERVPPNMRAGLEEPFGDKFEAAWQGLTNLVPKRHRSWIDQLAARNRDLTSFLASALLAFVISSILHFTAFGFFWAGVLSYLFACLVSWLFFGCFSLVRRTILSVLEIIAISHSLQYGSARDTRARQDGSEIELKPNPAAPGAGGDRPRE